MIDIVWMWLLITRHSRIIHARIRKSSTHKIYHKIVLWKKSVYSLFIGSYAHFASPIMSFACSVYRKSYLQVDQVNRIMHRSDRLLLIPLRMVNLPFNQWPYVQESFQPFDKISHRKFLCLVGRVKCWVIVIMCPKGVNKEKQVPLNYLSTFPLVILKATGFLWSILVVVHSPVSLI